MTAGNVALCYLIAGWFPESTSLGRFELALVFAALTWLGSIWSSIDDVLRALKKAARDQGR